MTIKHYAYLYDNEYDNENDYDNVNVNVNVQLLWVAKKEKTKEEIIFDFIDKLYFYG